MLLINPKNEKTITHVDSGATFDIRAISPKEYDDIRRKSCRNDKTLDVSKWGANFAQAAIGGWSGVGSGSEELPCDDANKRAFGAAQAVNVMPWIIEEATSLDFYKSEEEAAAKKD